jgi:hypothetical protein
MEFKKTRVKQVLTAIKTVRESFKQLQEEQQEYQRLLYNVDK